MKTFREGLTIALAFGLVGVAVWLGHAYYTWPCERLGSNIITQNMTAPARCIR